MQKGVVTGLKEKRIQKKISSLSKRTKEIKIMGSRKRAGAYFTVEAAMVLPLATGILLFVIYFMLYQYNRCLMEQDAILLALRAESIQETDKEKLEEAFKREEDRQDKKKYIAWKHTGTKVTLKGYKMIICRSGHLRFDPERGWKAQVSCENTRISPAFFLRNCRRLLKE